MGLTLCVLKMDLFSEKPGPGGGGTRVGGKKQTEQARGRTQLRAPKKPSRESCLRRETPHAHGGDLDLLPKQETSLPCPQGRQAAGRTQPNCERPAEQDKRWLVSLQQRGGTPGVRSSLWGSAGPASEPHPKSIPTCGHSPQDAPREANLVVKVLLFCFASIIQ